MNRYNSFRPKKSLGQNFLVNAAVARRIISACDLQPDETILEIGPGKGALTHDLALKVKQVIAVEKDQKLAEHLHSDFQNTNVRVIQADILKYPLTNLPPHTKIIGNLPYNIATPIIEAILKERHRFSSLYATVQWEYGRRLMAGPNTKDYGSFSCFVQYYADIKLLFKIKNAAFQPVPKVQSCFLQFRFPEKRKTKADNEEFLFHMIRTCFGQRRKKIRNTLAGFLGKEKSVALLEKLKISPELRAENLSLEEFIRLSNAAL